MLCVRPDLISSVFLVETLLLRLIFSEQSKQNYVNKKQQIFNPVVFPLKYFFFNFLFCVESIPLCRRNFKVFSALCLQARIHFR